MKKILMFLILFVCLAGTVQAALTYDSANYLKNKVYADSGNTLLDPVYLNMNEVETRLEAWTLDGGTILTFPTNSGTISNATNGRFIFTESEDLQLIFGSNSATLYSSTGVLGVDFNDLYLVFTEISAPSGNPASNKGWLYTKDSTGTTKLYFEDSAGTVTDLLTAATGNTLDQAYDQGGAGAGKAITVDTGAIALSNTDADTAWLLTLNASPGSSAALGGMQITCGSNATQDALEFANSGSGNDIYGSGGTWTVTKAGAITSSSITATTGTFTTLYKQAVVAASGGNVALTVDAAGNGTITLGGTSTGAIVHSRDTDLNGDTTDIGDAATDTLTITSKVDGDVTLDDDSTDSPALILRDAGENDWQFAKANGATGNLTATSDAGTSDFQIVTGNLKVGAGTEGVALNGEDAYVTGTLEVDGAAQFDGNPTINGETTINDQIAIAFGSNDEEITLTGTATDLSAAAMITAIMAAQDNQAYILALQQTPDADADNDFIVCEDNAGDDKLTVSQGGTTAWTLDAASLVSINGDTTNNTTTGGILDIDFESATTGGEAINVKAISGVAISETTAAITIDLDDDTAAAASIYGIDIAASDATGSSVLYGLNIANSIDTHINSALPTGGTWAVIDGATADNTVTSGILDIDWDSIATNGEAVNIKATQLTGGAGVADAAVEIELDSDSGNASDILYGMIINATDTTATGKVKGLYVKGAGVDAGIQLDTGYLRIGTGSTPDVTPSDDDAFIEGTLEVDGAARFDGNIARASQRYVQSIAYAKVGGTSGWTVGAADNVSLATLPQSQTGSTLIIPVTVPLKVGYVITGFSINGQLDSAGNTATLDADLRKHTEADAGYADASIGTIIQVSKTADYKIVDANSLLNETVAADESYYIKLTGTTAATTDIEIASVTLTVSEI